MARGDIGGVIDFKGDLDTTEVGGELYPTSIVKVAGTVFAVAYQGCDVSTSRTLTINISDAGAISTPAIQIFDFQATLSGFKHMIKLEASADIWLKAEDGNGNDGWLRPLQIDALGNITYLGGYEFDPDLGKNPRPLQVAGDIYVIFYWTNVPSNSLKLVTVQVNPDGSIVPVNIDFLNVIASASGFGDIQSRGGNIFVLMSMVSSTHTYIQTVEILANGQIGAAVISSLDLGNIVAYDLVPIGGGLYVAVGSQKAISVSVSADGSTITQVDTLLFPAPIGSNITARQIVPGVIAEVFMHPVNYKGYVRTFGVTGAGIFTGQIDLLEYALTMRYTNKAGFVRVAGDVYAVSHCGVGGTVAITTLDIESGEAGSQAHIIG